MIGKTWDMAILEGSVYSCDLKDLAFVSKVDDVGGKPAIRLLYKQGLNVTVKMSSIEERNRQYNDIVTLWKNSTVTD